MFSGSVSNPADAVNLRRHKSAGGAGGRGRVQLCYLFIYFRLCLVSFVRLLVVFSEADSPVFVSPFHLACPCLLTVHAIFFVYLASQLLQNSTFFSLVCFGPFSFLFLLSTRLLHCLPPLFCDFPVAESKIVWTERKRERDASFCFWLWIEALLLIAKLRSDHGLRKTPRREWRKRLNLFWQWSIRAVSLWQLRGQLGFRFFGFSLLERDDASVSLMRFLVVREYVCIYGKHLRKIG